MHVEGKSDLKVVLKSLDGLFRAVLEYLDLTNFSDDRYSK